MYCVFVLPLVTTGRGFTFTFTEEAEEDSDTDDDDDDDVDVLVPGCTGWTVLLTTAMVPPPRLWVFMSRSSPS